MRTMSEGPEVQIRPASDEDLDWIVDLHRRIYWEEQGWDQRFMDIVEEIVDEFRGEHEGEQCWVAEMEGDRVGSILLARQEDRTAKLRILLVEPTVRGRGIGTALVVECLAFAKTVGYHKITLGTDSNLHAARRIYERTGFLLVEEVPHDDYGQGLVAENWELEL
jgi:GNAT superfamily N-acetyltransferase